MSRIQEAILGDRIYPGLCWTLATIGANFGAFAALMVYAGPWLVRAQHASLGLVSTTLFIGGVAGVAGALLAGRIVHAVDRRRLIIVVAAVQTVATAMMALPVTRQIAIAALVTTVGTQPLRGVAQRTLIADADAGEKGFADFRLAMYVGSFAGPAAAGLLAGWGWPELRIGVTAMYAISLACALVIPRPQPHGTAPIPAMTVILRDGRLWLLLTASTTAWTVMYVFETVLPTVAVGSGDISSRAWGLLYSVGPLYVLVCQLRIQRGLRGLAVRARLAGGLAMMGLAFGVFTIGLSAATLVAFLPVFLTGDMIWGPASDDLVARTAPPGRVGVYFGVTTATMWAGSALAPAIGLTVAQALGDAVLWWGTASMALLSAVCYMYAARGASGDEKNTGVRSVSSSARALGPAAGADGGLAGRAAGVGVTAAGGILALAPAGRFGHPGACRAQEARCPAAGKTLMSTPVSPVRSCAVVIPNPGIAPGCPICRSYGRRMSAILASRTPIRAVSWSMLSRSGRVMKRRIRPPGQAIAGPRARQYCTRSDPTPLLIVLSSPLSAMCPRIMYREDVPAGRP